MLFLRDMKVCPKHALVILVQAIDEAESEWSQHNAKKIIDTRGKGLRASIPKNFPYFHVEFGLQGGYAHVIDVSADVTSSANGPQARQWMQEWEYGWPSYGV